MGGEVSDTTQAAGQYPLNFSSHSIHNFSFGLAEGTRWAGAKGLKYKKWTIVHGS